MGVDLRPPVTSAVDGQGQAAGEGRNVGVGYASSSSRRIPSSDAAARESTDSFCPPRLAWVSSERLVVGWGRRLSVLQRTSLPEHNAHEGTSNNSSQGAPPDFRRGSAAAVGSRSVSSSSRPRFGCVATVWMPHPIAGIACLGQMEGEDSRTAAINGTDEDEARRASVAATIQNVVVLLWKKAAEVPANQDNGSTIERGADASGAMPEVVARPASLHLAVVQINWDTERSQAGISSDG